MFGSLCLTLVVRSGCGRPVREREWFLPLDISFFFQAEDGIRDGHVTGVQTCALPIFEALIELEGALPLGLGLVGDLDARLLRSEERRVGKECSTWWLAEPSNKKDER